ncbi:MAG: hypothetical protein FWC20_08025 [Oscillospiraceae bacterium]|nr:hypothetical protein [Oscillospiraceae bacterium]MCL2279332.1 hypothetical protein [Oscillospiraceae bacterium]
MRNLSKPSQKIILWIMISAGIIMAIGGVVYRSWEALPFILSVAIISALNIGKIWMLERAVNKITEMDNPDTGKTYVKFQYLVRYFGTAIVLLAIGLLYVYTPMPISTVWGAIAGLFTMQIAVMVVRFMKFDEDTDEESPNL